MGIPVQTPAARRGQVKAWPWEPQRCLQVIKTAADQLAENAARRRQDLGSCTVENLRRELARGKSEGLSPRATVAQPNCALMLELRKMIATRNHFAMELLTLACTKGNECNSKTNKARTMLGELQKAHPQWRVLEVLCVFIKEQPAI